MEYTLYWNNDEEGLLTFFDYDKTEWLCFEKSNARIESK